MKTIVDIEEEMSHAFWRSYTNIAIRMILIACDIVRGGEYH